MDLVVESLADGTGGLAGDLAREGFSEEEVNIFLSERVPRDQIITFTWRW